MNYVGGVFPYLVIAAGIVLILNFILGLAAITAVAGQKQAESAWRNKEPQYQKIVALKKEVSESENEYNSLNQLTNPSVGFSKVLYLLYNNLPNNIWFENINFSDGVLNINGKALDFTEEAPLSLKNYVDTLKGSDLVQRFSKINIHSQEMRRVGDKQVLSFVLELK